MNGGITPEHILNDLLYSMAVYQRIIQILLEHEDSDGICLISQSEIANRLRISPINVSKRMRNLEAFDECVVQLGRGRYRVKLRDMRTHGPIARSLRYVESVLKNPELIKLPLNIQAERLDLTTTDVQRAMGLFKYGVRH